MRHAAIDGWSRSARMPHWRRVARLLIVGATLTGSGSCRINDSAPFVSPFEVVAVDGWNDVVIDTRSGLMWTRDANLLRLTPSSNPGGYGLSISDAFVFRNVVNDELFAGYSNWRVPSIAEFADFLGKGLDSKAFPGPFQNIVTGHWYWSSTSSEKCEPSIGCYDSYVRIDAENGFVYPSLSGSKAYVWLVRNP